MRTFGIYEISASRVELQIMIISNTVLYIYTVVAYISDIFIWNFEVPGNLSVISFYDAWPCG